MATDLSTFETLVAAAQAAVASGDYTTAYSKATQAEIIFAGLPEEVQTGTAKARYRQNCKIFEVVERMESRTTVRNAGKRFITARTNYQR